MYVPLLALILGSPVAFSSSLPRGKAPGPGVKYKIVHSKDEDLNCHQYHMNPASGEIAFDPMTKEAFFLGQNPINDPNKKPIVKLIKLDLSSLEAKKLISLKVNSRSKFVLHQSPAEAISLFHFRKGERGCGQGIAKGLGVKWVGKRRIIKTYDKQYYKILKTHRGLKILDRKASVVRDFDLKTLQKRVTENLPKKGMPLYTNSDSGIAYHYDPENNGSILRYNVLKLELEGQMKLAAGMKIVQQEYRFGVAKVKEAEGQIVVNQIKGWSGKSFRKFVYKSSDLDLKSTKLIVDFKTGVGVLTGRSEAASREFKKVEIYDGIAKKSLESVKPPKNHFFSSVALSPDGKFVVILARHLADYSLGAVSVYDLNLKAMKQIHLK